MNSSPEGSLVLGNYFFYVLRRATIRDFIFREMLCLEDVACLEVAAAVHRLHDQEQVTSHSYAAHIFAMIVYYFNQQLFNFISRPGEFMLEKHYPWMSRRGYKLDAITITISDFEVFTSMIGEISPLTGLLLSNRRYDENITNALSVFRLIGLNPLVKKLTIKENANNCTYGHMFGYLAQHCREVKEVRMFTGSAEAIRLAMTSFPNLSAIHGGSPSSGCSFDISLYLGELSWYPKIVYFDFMGLNKDQDLGACLSLIKACPNLRTLACTGSWFCQGQIEVISSCRRLATLILYYFESAHHNAAPMLSAIAEYGLQLKELYIYSHNLIIDLRNHATRYDFTKIMNRLKIFHLIAGAEDLIYDDNQSISSLFSSPDIDLQSLCTKTFDESSDGIAIMLRGCSRANRLELSGKANINEVVTKISDHCLQLADLTLKFKGQVDGAAMRMLLLQSSCQLTSLSLQANYNLQVYEHLAFHGGNKTKLILHRDQSPQSPEYTCMSFDTSSPICETSFKQQRKHPMIQLTCWSLNLDINSFVKFLSCFGMIDDLSFSLDTQRLSTDINDHIQNDENLVYHARKVFFCLQMIKCCLYDSAFLAIMSSCRSLRELRVDPKDNATNDCSTEASNLISKCACMCSLKNPLTILSYPHAMHTTELKQLLPKLKLRMI
jgi:hypothetical protein